MSQLWTCLRLHRLPCMRSIHLHVHVLVCVRVRSLGRIRVEGRSWSLRSVYSRVIPVIPSREPGFRSILPASYSCLYHLHPFLNVPGRILIDLGSLQGLYMHSCRMYMLSLMLRMLLVTLILEWKVTEDARERGGRKGFLRSRKRVRRRIGRSRVRWLIHGRYFTK
jgi:hypothetical protein